MRFQLQVSLPQPADESGVIDDRLQQGRPGMPVVMVELAKDLVDQLPDLGATSTERLPPIALILEHGHRQPRREKYTATLLS